MYFRKALAILSSVYFLVGTAHAQLVDVKKKSKDEQRIEILAIIQDIPEVINGQPLDPGQRLQIKNNNLTNLISESALLCELDSMNSAIQEQKVLLSYLNNYGPKLFPFQTVYVHDLSLRFKAAEAKINCGQYTQENLDEMASVIKATPPVFILRDHPGFSLPGFELVPSIHVLETQYLLIAAGYVRSYLLNRRFESLSEFIQVSEGLVSHLKAYYESHRSLGIDPSVMRLTEILVTLVPRSVPLKTEDEKKLWLDKLELIAKQYREEYSTHPTLSQARATAHAQDTISKFLAIAKSQMLKARFAYGLDLTDVQWELKRQKLEKFEPGPLKMNFAIATGGSGLFAIDLMRAYAKFGNVKSFEQFIEVDFPIHVPRLSSTDPRDPIFTPSIYSLAMYLEAHLASLQLGLDDLSESFLTQFLAEVEALAYGNWIYAGRFNSEVFDQVMREYLFQVVDFHALNQPQKAKVAKTLYRIVRLIGLVNEKLDRMDQRLNETSLAQLNEATKPLKYKWELDLARFKASPSEANRVNFRNTNERLLQLIVAINVGNPISSSIRKEVLSRNFGSFLHNRPLPTSEAMQLVWLQDQNTGQVKLITAEAGNFAIYDLDLRRIQKYTILVSETMRSDSTVQGLLTRASLKLLTQAALPEPVRVILANNPGRRIDVYAEGFLSVIPVDILLTNDDRFLIQTHSILYQALPGQSLDAGNSDVAQIKNVAVFADADYGQMPESAITLALRNSIEVEKANPNRSGSFLTGLQPLPYTRNEAIAIKSNLSSLGADITIFDGKAATIENLMTVQRPNILHLALHGFVQSDKAIYRGESLQYLTGIAFAGANEDPRSLFTVNTVSKPDLHGTDLVVLAACDTSVSDFTQANDYVSMRNMFFKLGVLNVIAANWSLPDAQTSEVMALFYRNLANKLSFEDSLRAAKLEQMEKTPNPKYWAGLTLTKR
ncbi:MAG: CHAT domain-containing protein [Limnobacter sp.]|uniref:CHAT domain-containing protein n=1 Tax=Limnobacter sp. TaxID=2003368 RepID=UPI00391A23EF